MAQQQRAARGQLPLDYMLNRFIVTFFVDSVLCCSLKHELACRLARRTERSALMLRSTTRRRLQRPAACEEQSKARKRASSVKLLLFAKFAVISGLATF